MMAILSIYLLGVLVSAVLGYLLNKSDMLRNKVSIFMPLLSWFLPIAVLLIMLIAIVSALYEVVVEEKLQNIKDWYENK